MKESKHRKLSIILIILLLSFSYFSFRLLKPYDEIQMDIKSIPINTDFLCVIASTDNGLMPLNWSISKVFPSSMHPDRCTISFLDTNKNQYKAQVRWIFNNKIGVLQRTENEWRIFWFQPPKNQLNNRTFLFGRGSLTIDISEADSQSSISITQLRSLGMEYCLTKD